MIAAVVVFHEHVLDGIRSELGTSHSLAVSPGAACNTL